MATFGELQERVAMLVMDDSLEAMLSSLINQGVNEIAGGMQSALGDWTTPPLPDLFTIGTVDTSTSVAYVNMPTNFQRDLQLVVRSTGQEVNIANSFIEFTETYPALDKTGIISEAAEQGGKFYYQGIPSVSESVTLHYYRRPVDMVDNDDTPDGIPLHLQFSLLVNYAAWKAYEFIEDGIEGETPNTQKYMGLFLSALRTLELSVPYDNRGLMLR